MADVFAIQDEISQAITEKLRVHLAGGGSPVKDRTENPEVYDLCLKARYYLTKATPESTEKSRQYCEQAITLDPSYALGHVRLAQYYWMAANLGFLRPRSALPKAKSAVLEALRLDDTKAEAHSILGMLLGTGDFDWAGAEREHRRALELGPASPDVHYWAHYHFYATGRLDEAIIEIRKALEQDGLSPQYNFHLGLMLNVAHQYDRAIEQLRFAIELDPNYPSAHVSLALAYLMKGRRDEAIATAEKALALSGRSSLHMYALGLVYAYTGRPSEARQLLEELKQRSRAAFVSPFAIGMIHLALGELEEAFEQLMIAIEEHDLPAVWDLKTDPSFDPFRSDPRFQAILRKMNLYP